MNLNDALEQIANKYNLDAAELKAFAAEDKVGGYHPNKALSKWTIGSLWEVEGKVLYALIRALKPKTVLEVGSFYGASTSHIAEAMIANRQGKIICVDKAHMFDVPKRYADIVEQVSIDLFKYKFPLRKIDFVFEDASHSAEEVKHVWGEFKAKAKKGAMIISHDAMHYIVGKSVREGISYITGEALFLDIAPSDCGLAIWTK